MSLLVDSAGPERSKPLSQTIAITGIVVSGSFRDERLTLHNNGPCLLSIENVTSSSPEFATPLVSSYPLIVAAGASIAVPIRFQPISFGAKSATITVFSNDPKGPKSMLVSGTAPAGKIAVTGSILFRAGRTPVATPSVPFRYAMWATASFT